MAFIAAGGRLWAAGGRLCAAGGRMRAALPCHV